MKFKKLKMTLFSGKLAVAVACLLIFGAVNFAWAGGATESGKEEVRLSYWVGGYPPQGIAKLDELAKSFAEETGIIVEITTYPWAEIWKKLISAIDLGSPPDMWEGGIFPYHGMGAVRSLTKEFESLPYKNNFPQAYVDEITLDGERYAIPRIMTVWQIMINKEKFEQVGLDPQQVPTDWQDLLSMAKKLTLDTNKDGEIDQWGWGSHGGYLSSHVFLVWMYNQIGKNISTKEGELFITQYRDEVINAIEFMNALAVNSPGGPEPAAAYTYANLLQMMAEEDIAMMVTTGYNARSVIEMNPELEGKIGFINLPKKPLGFSMAGGGYTVMSSSCKYPDEAWQFIQYLQEPVNCIESTTLNKFIPARTDLIDHPLLAKDPYAKYMMQQAEQGVIKQEPHPEWGALREKVMDAIAATLLGEKTVEKAVDDMFKAMAIIQESY